MQYVKTADGQWLFTELEGESVLLSLQSIDFEIALNDLYEKVNFQESEED